MQDYENFLQKELRGEIPSGKGLVPSMRTANDALVNNNTGATGTQSFTQSETTILAYGSNVLVSFNDAGSYTGGANKFTGYSYSTDGGSTFTDGGNLPTNAGGDAGALSSLVMKLPVEFTLQRLDLLMELSRFFIQMMMALHGQRQCRDTGRLK